MLGGYSSDQYWLRRAAVWARRRWTCTGLLPALFGLVTRQAERWPAIEELLESWRESWAWAERSKSRPSTSTWPAGRLMLYGE